MVSQSRSVGRKYHFRAAAILVGVAEIPVHPRGAAVQHPLFRLDKKTRRDLGAAVERGRDRKWSVGYEVVQPTHEVLRVERKPVPLDPAVGRPHPVSRLVDRHTGRKRSGREGQHAVGIVERRVLGTRLIEIGKTVLPGPGIRGTNSNANRRRRRSNRRTSCVICRVLRRVPSVPTRRCRKTADACRSCWPRYSGC